ncbi:FAD-dependent oxidoreductase [Streptomyces sp. NPDC056713]|uniref:FAD-dependent oxidoreductase n=1 Tax=Streptomyces sp. NPDC056713 TaxID=3345921 RepID=UPI0036942EE2
MLSRAGIVSSSVAYHLARRGVPVTLLEQEPAPATCVTGDSFAWISSSASDRPAGFVHENRQQMSTTSGDALSPSAVLPPEQRIRVRGSC